MIIRNSNNKQKENKMSNTNNEVVQAQKTAIWPRIFDAAMKLPMAKIDRQSFLRQEFSPYFSGKELDHAIADPVGVVGVKQLDKIADACIRNHLLCVTASSFAAGLPGGLLMSVTIPADVAQTWWHILCLAQKLAYVYGIPDFCDEHGNLTEVSRDLLTIYVGVMLGASAANKAVGEASRRFAGQVVKRIPKMPLTKYTIYKIAKQLAGWISVKLTKDSFAKSLAKAVPVVSGFICGAITFATFRPAAKRLQKKLSMEMCR